MTRTSQLLPTAVTGVLIAGALIHGPIAQLPHYHDFADQTTRFGILHFYDVASNLGFLLVALWGYASLGRHRAGPDLANGWGGYRLFLLGLLLTGVGSSYYHLAPDNARLVWDRLPIALACGGLLAGVWGDTQGRDSRQVAAALALVAVCSVAWWYFTELAGDGDLRPYLLLQALPFLLIPLWQWQYASGKCDRWYFGFALILYAAAKWAELNDHDIGAVVGMTGHTLKHLLATLACASIVGGLNRRVLPAPASPLVHA
ncbi:MAG: alkaline phytoceramidase [Ignavibacteria bacterium]